MKQALIFAFFLTGLNFLGHAQTTHRITVADNLQTKLDAATDGDIFLVEAGNYGDVNVRKRVTLIGNGYFLAETASASSSLLGYVKFLTGSEGSWITGFQTGDINVSVSNISIRRNHTGTIRLGIDESTSYWNGIVSDCSVQQNIGERFMAIAASPPGKVGSFICTNNIFKMGFHLQGILNGIVENNTFDSDISGSEINGSQSYVSQGAYYNNGSACGKQNIMFKNNIMTNISYQGVGWCTITDYPTDVFINNILHQGPGHTIPASLAGTSNKIITDLSTLYVGYPDNPNGLALDARSQLAPGSPAIGAGEGGTDAGAFGGTDPYVLGGLPAIPSIYYLQVPSTVSQGGTLQVQIKAKTNN